MIAAGIDIGSRSAKAVIINEKRIMSQAICDSGPESAKTALKVMNEVMKKTNISIKDIDYIVATGYGRIVVPFANKNISEISCHAKGINYYFPQVRTILDMGGQDCKAIRCDENGKVTNFVMNDKCAGGTGRFIELMGDLLKIPLEDIGELSLQSKDNIQFSNICAIYAKTEALSLLKKGINKKDILAGLHDAIASRCISLLRRVSVEKEFAISGGIAKNIGMVKKLEEKLNLKALIAPDPQIIGALGAACQARTMLILNAPPNFRD